MRILFLTLPYPDYVSDTLFHGLRTILGKDVVDYPYQSRLYKGGEKPAYGKGFTAWNLLDEIEIDRSIETVLEQTKVGGYFDVVVVNASMYETLDRDYMEEIFALWYEAGRVNDTLRVMIDGGDHPYVSPSHKEFGKPILFKRENEEGFGLPISISIPKEKLWLVQEEVEKTKWLADVDPRKHTFDTEEAYYAELRRSVFCHSPKKAGWDCMRHYEIMANQCLPVILPSLDMNYLDACNYCADMDTPCVLPRIPTGLLSMASCAFMSKEPGLEHSLQSVANIVVANCTTQCEATRFIAALRGLGAG